MHRVMTDTAVAAEITVRVNGDERAIPPGLSVAGLLAHLGLEPRMIVVEQNGDILRREAYADAAVREGDQLELVHFVGGG
jgi:sulfur carrier protein